MIYYILRKKSNYQMEKNDFKNIHQVVVEMQLKEQMII